MASSVEQAAFHVDVVGPSAGGKTALVRALRRRAGSAREGGTAASILDTIPTTGIEIDEVIVGDAAAGGTKVIRLREIGSAMRANWSDYLPLPSTAPEGRGVLFVLDGSRAGQAFLAEALVDLVTLNAIKGLPVVIAATKADRDPSLMLSDEELRDCLMLLTPPKEAAPTTATGPAASVISIIRCSPANGKGLDEVLSALASTATAPAAAEATSAVSDPEPAPAAGATES